MNKVRIKKYAFIVAMGLLVAATAQAATRNVTRYDDFSAPGVPSFWVLDIDPLAFPTSDPNFPTPGVAFTDGTLRFNNVGNNAYAHLESAAKVETTGPLRVDAIMRQAQYSSIQSWGMCVAIYWDVNNSVAIKQCDAGGAYGWARYLLNNGTMTQLFGNVMAGLSGFWIISGIELTPTQIIFYGSSISPWLDQFGVTDIDANVTEITEFRMARPATFTGPATIIVGKGYGNPNASYAKNPDFDNSIGSDKFTGYSGIDLIRTEMTVTDPNVCGEQGTVYLPMDFNHDCHVDITDLQAFVGYWLECTDPQNALCDRFWRP
jgi:hypothetical protein